MCGIFCSLCFHDPISKRHNVDIDQEIHKSLLRRGPDKHGLLQLQLGRCDMIMSGYVLHMQGNDLKGQPVVTSKGNVLLYNGDIFGGIEIPHTISDTCVLLEMLDNCIVSEDVIKVMEAIQGPWSIVYYQKAANNLWFGRDYFGRRSLLMHFSPQQICISSVAKRTATSSWLEVPTGLHCINLDVDGNDVFKNFKTFPWLSITDHRAKFDASTPPFSEFAKGPYLTSSITTRPLNTALTLAEKYVNLNDNHTGSSLIDQLVSACEDKSLWMACRKLISVLENSVKRRTRTLESWKQGSKVGVLFSGGVDCTVLTLLADRVLPRDSSIDLLNVAFEQGKTSGLQADPNATFAVPDRITGLASYEELRRLCPWRRWNFVAINITVEELREQRAARVSSLAYPKQTVLDDSISCALWFASRGEGLLKEANGTLSSYRSSCRILLCGMGADEQLGGYARHRTVYGRSKDWAAVEREIDMEIERISSRNLGRDNRIIADHGREARFPYLDEEVVGYLRSLSVQEKTDFRFPRGVGEKILLRGAAFLSGLREAAVLPKRAIQFGSRIAKAEAGREKGSDPCPRLFT